MCITIALGALGAAVAGSSQPSRTPLSSEFANTVKAAISALDQSDNFKSADSGILAWGESYVLTGYYWMYEATRDPAWLDRIVRHADVIFANLSPGDELFPGWRTTRYSVALARAEAAPDNPSPASVQATPPRIYDIETAHKVTGHDYELRVAPSGVIEITDTTTGERVAATDLAPDGQILQILGVVLAVKGQPQPGDRFIVKTQAPKPMEYVVHDGIVLTPIALFCAAVHDDTSLAPTYREAAKRYLQIMETQLLPKWEPYWRDLPDGSGLYIAQNDPAQRFPEASLPHNQYLALGRTFIALYRITGNARYRERAQRMARFFKRNLRLVGEHYEWNYWDYAGSWDTDARAMAHVEDTSHGAIDVGFALDAYDASIVFDRQDLERFAHTVSDVMWNGSEEKPRVGATVNAKGEEVQQLDWVRLGRFSLKTRQIMVRMLESLNPLGGSGAAAAAQALATERLRWNPRPLHQAVRSKPASK